jgi:hypothetical protein
VTALIRYLIADLGRSQRWVAPALAYLAVVAILGPAGTPPGSTALAAVALFPIGSWLAWVTATCEDPVQESVTATAAGGLRRVRLGKFAAGTTVTALLGSLALLLTAAEGGRDPAVLAAATAAIVSNVVGGSAVGFACARPVFPRRGLAVTTIVLACLVELIVPRLPPVRATLEILNDGRDMALRLGLTALVTTIGAAALVTVAVTVTERRL